ncbi:response regulator transcription factor [Azospirillum sp. TSO35-2]|uniref:response regulator transcription factor n=1 Tax=Azospirillum sp. TSO35-2 TaxID=716796 RepID=UPI000D611529|nr:response regulator transcription factor [Azospirillum sp. TSO35-2]PWC31192.1 hypothetical protein TSO352_30780 [Azospirillum sp. TSO35-2]
MAHDLCNDEPTTPDAASQDRDREPDGRSGRRFLIVDDHALVRHGLSLMIRQRFTDADVYEAGTLSDALDKVRALPGLTAVLFDLQLEDSDGLPGVEAMLEANGQVPLIVVSGTDDRGVIAGCIRAGARGFVSKGCEATALDQALPVVLGGGIYAPAPPSSARGGQPIVIADPAAPSVTAAPVATLTERQQSVLRLLLEGRSNKEIARALGVLEGTIKVHLRSIMQRLGARNRTQLALVAVRAGMAPEDMTAAPAHKH